jgi:hypothetical protein
MRRAARVDNVQAEIVEGLRKLGYTVVVIGRPVDLLVVHPRLKPPFHAAILEVKSCTKSGARRVRRDQPEQDRFIADNRVPVVMSLDQALHVLEGL